MLVSGAMPSLLIFSRRYSRAVTCITVSVPGVTTKR